MCQRDYEIVLHLYESINKMRPMPEATTEEMAWYRGTLHGIKLAIQQLSTMKDAA